MPPCRGRRTALRRQNTRAAQPTPAAAHQCRQPPRPPMEAPARLPHRHLTQYLAGLLKTRPLHDLLSDASTSGAARHLFDAVPRPSPALCGTLLSALSSLSSHRELLEAFSSLHRRGAAVPPGCVPLVVKSCALSAASRQGREVHCHALVRGLLGDAFVQTALVDFYAKNSDMECAVKVFQEMPIKDPIPMNCLITGYSKSGDVNKARKLFDGMTRRTSASWNSMIACYAHVFSICAKTGDLATGKRTRSLVAEEDLQNTIVHTALMEIMSSVGLLMRHALGSDELGGQIGRYVEIQRLPLTSYLGYALIDMYTKCGHVGRARDVFKQMEQKVVVTWNTMMRDLARNGFAQDAITLYKEMVEDGVQPTEITFVALLTACTHAGLVVGRPRHGVL
ncbi:hypothetical protein ABZP36_028049 [Zizania latifolia]